MTNVFKQIWVPNFLKRIWAFFRQIWNFSTAMQIALIFNLLIFAYTFFYLANEQHWRCQSLFSLNLAGLGGPSYYQCPALVLIPEISLKALGTLIFFLPVTLPIMGGSLYLALILSPKRNPEKEEGQGS